MLWLLFALLIVLWLLGFGFHIAGGMVHILLVIAFILLIINVATHRRSEV